MTNIQELIAQRQFVLEDWLDRKVLSHVHGHSSLVERLGFVSQLEGHRGCVNCLEWNSTGSLLASGSDDLSAIVWDPYQRKSVAIMPTGHTGNIFSVKFLPFSGDHLLLTGAEDREVRMHDLNSFETTQVWSCSQSRVKRIATSPRSPFLCWSAAEDGCIRQFDIREPHSCQSDNPCRNVLIDLKPTCGTSAGNTQCKCLDVNPVRHEQIAVGALDAYVRLYDTRILTLKRTSREVSDQADPSCLAHFAPGHISNPRTRRARKTFSTLATTYLTFSPSGSELLINLSGEHVYLYDTVNCCEALKYDFDKSDSMSVPKLQSHTVTYNRTKSTTNMRRVITNPFYGVPNVPVPEQPLEESSVSEEVKRIKETGNELYKVGNAIDAVEQYSKAIQLCPMWHVLYSNRATALFSRKWEGDIYAALRDTEIALMLSPSHKKALQRRLRCLYSLCWYEEAQRFLQEYKQNFPQDKEFYPKFHSELEKATSEAAGKNGFRTERRHLTQWEITRQQTAYDYKSRYCGHCNTHTDIKEANFLGERGEYVAAGSDDGNIFIWEKISGNLVRILHGDDSIVNCVQWHPTGPLLASSGIESVVRLWEPRPVGEKDDRVIPDCSKVCRENQHRMKVDPFEIMLMRMGFHVALAQEHAGPDNQQGGRGGGGGGGEEEGAPGWMEDPTGCRQS